MGMQYGHVLEINSTINRLFYYNRQKHDWFAVMETITVEWNTAK